MPSFLSIAPFCKQVSVLFINMICFPMSLLVHPFFFIPHNIHFFIQCDRVVRFCFLWALLQISPTTPTVIASIDQLGPDPFCCSQRPRFLSRRSTVQGHKDFPGGWQRSPPKNQLPGSPLQAFRETNLTATPCHRWGSGYSRSARGKLPLSRTDISSNIAWHCRHRCPGGLSPKKCNGWVGFTDDGILLSWQSGRGCFRGSQAVGTLAATASNYRASRSCSAISSCVPDCWSGATPLPFPGRWSHLQRTYEPLNGPTWNDRLVAQPTNL